jgi:F-type H+-transporting ATPase subunit delta
MSSKAARRYASALLGYAQETKSVEIVLKDVQFIHETLKQSKELSVFLKSPVIKDAKKMSVLSDIFKKSISSECWKFFELLSEKSRLELLPAVTVAFIHAYNKYAGIIEIEVFSAFKPEESQLTEIKRSLEKSTSKKVNLTSKVDDKLLGGMVIKIDDTVIDGSVKNKLQQLEHLFFKAAI